MIKIDIKDYPPLPEYVQEYIEALDIKKSLAGHLMISNHDQISVVVNLSERKITAYSKGNFSDLVYNTQSRFFNHLVERGVVEPETIMGTNVFGALAGVYPQNEEIGDLSEVILYNIATFMQAEREYLDAIDRFEKQREDDLVNPSDEDSTELGEVPQETTKGSMQPYYPGYTYGLAGIYRYE